MKKIALLSLAVVGFAAPAFAVDTTTTAPAAAPAAMAPAAAPVAMAPTAKPTVMAAKKLELKDGTWAMVAPDGKVKTSKDGKMWTLVKAGTVLVEKDGAKLAAK